MIPLLLSTLNLASFSGEFTLHRAMDPTTGRVAMRYLLPKGWKASDTVQWNPTNVQRPNTAFSTLTSPDGRMRIDFLPAETFPFGVKDGQVSGTLPPETATKALDHVLSSQHPGVKNASLIFRKDFDVPTPFDGQEGLKTKGFVGILNVSFEEDGQPTTALLTVTEFEGSHQEGEQTQGITVMTQGYTLTCRGPMSNEAFKTFAIVIASHRPDPTYIATIMAVAKAAQAGGTPDVKRIATGIKGLPEEAKGGYRQNLSVHGASVGRIVPQTVYPGVTDVVTFDGSIMTFKGLHIWMRKPDDYVVAEGAEPPGSGWIAATLSPA